MAEENGSIARSRISRKRPRPIVLAVATTILASTPVTGFFPHSFRRFSKVDYLFGCRVADGRVTDQSSCDCGIERFNLPPWLDRYFLPSRGSEQMELDWLRFSLIHEHGLPANDAQGIIQAFHRTVNGDSAMAKGLSDFLRIILELDDVENGSNLLVSPEFLLASMIHYSDCIALRKSEYTLPTQNGENYCFRTQQALFPQVQTPTIILPSRLPLLSTYSKGTYKKIYQQASTIAKGAARIKRAEVLAQTNTERRHLPDQELRNLILTAMEDWRSLALRCIACLYRLEGIVAYQKEMIRAETTSEMVHTAREAMRVFSVLSERLGMHRLKAKIEERAFSILYKRQYRAVSTLYENSGLPMKKLSDHLLRSLTKSLHSDEALMSQLADLRITARVKEPFSFWKKLLKRKERRKLAPNSAIELSSSSRLKKSSEYSSGNISINELHDGIALRVIIQARRWSDDESDESLRAREHLLCYYVQKLIRSKWPESDPTRVKDYVSKPKKNGYQSLHHTSIVIANGIHFPFEVQVRSGEMHRLAEFGMAAHWDYKLASTSQLSLPSKGTTHQETTSDKYRIAGYLPPSQASQLLSRPRDEMATTCTGSGLCSDSERYIEALTTAKLEVEKQQVYIFLVSTTPGTQGRLISLPIQSSIADAIVAASNVMGDSETGMDSAVFWKNGKLAQLSDQVENGDFITFSVDAELPMNMIR